MSKKVKENPLFSGKTKELNVKGSNNTDSDSIEIKSFIVIIVIILLCIGSLYLVTNFIRNKKNDDNKEKVEKVEFNYDIVTVGTLLNRPYDEYYVMLFDSENDNAVLYSTLLSTGAQKQALFGGKIYYCDLGSGFNSNFYSKDGQSNPKATKTEDFMFGELTLVKVKDGKVSKYYEEYDKIKSVLNESN